ncbi:MAG: PBP1A family penicillin-binding protein [Clostridiales bacterium]|nr:PBP1A family penicillin-binding protein [Clostridiales bacterium]
MRILALALALVSASALIAGGLVYASIVRDLPDLEGPPAGRDQTSVITDRNGEVLATLFAEQNRTDRPLAEIPQALRQAVIATEDSRYYEHRGIDPIGIARALWVDIRTRSAAQGGSTITQQYVKNAFITPEKTLRRKISEAILAYRLEQRYSKDRVLELYLNTIYFGHGAYGVESAAQVYFGKPVDQLDLAESAMLAGVIKSPGRFSPYLEPEAAVLRRNTVLRQMTDQELITEEERAAAADAEPVLAGLSGRNVIAPYFVEYVKAQLVEEYGSDQVFRGGITVTTTLDITMQRAAEEAIAEALDSPDDPSAALVAIDPKTGQILAMVGGKDFSEKQFNVAVQGRRQPGSAFKPFVLATALAQGVTAEETYERGPARLGLSNGQTWSVTGATGQSGPMRLREAMEKSINSVFAQLVLEVGADAVIQTARTMGITTEISPVPAVALGGHAEGVSPLEMASAYGTLAAGGLHAEAHGISRVTDASGEVLFSAELVAQEVIDPAVAYLTTDVLRGVLTDGTGGVAKIGRPAAGKTGTTQQYRDAWFVGYTPDLVASVWVGHPEAAREMTNVRGRNVTGGSFPAEIWAAFMKRALADRDATEFSRPEGLVSASVCAESGGAASEWCETAVRGLFLAAHRPQPCSLHTGPERVVLPNLVGLTKEQALAKLAELELTATVTEESLRGIPMGLVARHSPAAETEVEVGTQVALVVSSGMAADTRPVPAFSITPIDARVGAPVTFDASTSTDDGTIVIYVWEFGDGAGFEGAKATHTYASAGTYEITLWVTDDNDQTSSFTQRITVR